MSIRQGIKLPLYIITEYGYENSLWAPRLYALIRHLKEKRLSYKQIEKITDIDCGGKSGSVIAIGTTHSWLLSTIKVCNKLNSPGTRTHPSGGVTGMWKERFAGQTTTR